ncbi:hypothetical protein PENANT_c121G00984 [Penicillium antarcticum]|uniref:DUF7223 domain-containing protein n=1 Tax=Penicillium antarcticum TaxID=416450 RepID=A0A1V6PI58_9EURO|nr:uncharacterized protein N7508_007453 [Penicillium antarcticum]KAJ5300210.1 hypothetical protein N7508_007453 [Penicillium antarcticum]OQD76748.1 hypothetical protein PENANT_c121G00984 [Penicillium antarcticum]
MAESKCVRVSTVPVEQRDVMDSADLSWGTYHSPQERRRTATKGHVQMMSSENKPYPHAATVDLETNVAAYKYFFNDTRSNITLTNTTVDAIEFAPRNGSLSKRRAHVRRRDDEVLIISDNGGKVDKSIWDGVKEWGQDAQKWIKSVPGKVVKMALAIRDLAKLGFDLAKVPFGYPFERSFSEDFKIKEKLVGKAHKILGHENGYQLGPKDEGEYGTVKTKGTIQCAKCGLSANFNVRGRLKFTREDGVTAATATFDNYDPITVDAIFGINGKISYEKTWEKPIPIKKQPTPIDIPGLITIGPMIKVNVAFTVTVEGEAEMLVGGSYSMAKGSATIDLVQSDNTAIEGLDQNFTPTIELSGTLTGTAEFGLPFTVEAGIDFLDGKWRATAGMTVSPAVYLKSIVTTKEGNDTCTNGLELRAGVKSPVVFSVLDRYNSDEFLSDPLYEHGLACFTKDGYQPNKVGPANGIIVDVISIFNGKDVSKDIPALDDVTAKFKQVTSNGNAGFQIVMTTEKDGILVSGTDGNIYLVASKADYDFSAPWASVDKSLGILNMDTFGRLIAYTSSTSQGAVLDLIVADPEVMPKGASIAGLAEVKDPSKQESVGPYTVFRGVKPRTLLDGTPSAYGLYAPTVCLGTGGLRLLGTSFVITDKLDDKGDVVIEDPMGYHTSDRNLFGDPRKALERGLDHLGYDIANCRSVKLTHL